MLENAGKVFGPKRYEVRTSAENFTIRSFIVCTLYLVLFRMIMSRRMLWVGHVAHMGKW
jgi:hypothetical protein